MKKFKIYDEIHDLSGIRVSLFFPSDKEIIEQIINQFFTIEIKKDFPKDSKKPKYEKRFSGYCANHYIVKMNDSSPEERYRKCLLEIQVASVLMLAWSEIEHDMIYKPNSGNLTKEEYSILDELNGLVIAGEIALERLKTAMTERIEEKKKVENNYEISNYLSMKLPNSKYDIGNTNELMAFLNATSMTSISSLNKVLKNRVFNFDNPISEQIIDNIINLNIKDEKLFDNIKNYIFLKTNEKYFSGFDRFLKSWILLEKIIREISKEMKIQVNFMSSDFFMRMELVETEKKEIVYSRKVRNELLHGIEPYKDFQLSQLAIKNKKLIKKLIERIKNKAIKNIYMKEYLDLA